MSVKTETVYQHTLDQHNWVDYCTDDENSDVTFKLMHLRQQHPDKTWRAVKRTITVEEEVVAKRLLTMQDLADKVNFQGIGQFAISVVMEGDRIRNVQYISPTGILYLEDPDDRS